MDNPNPPLDKPRPSTPGITYPPSLTPHLFMGRSKVTTGRIHQMRAGKSYLAKPPSWSNRDSPSLCSRCRAAPQTCKQAFLQSKARQDQRNRLLLGISSVDGTSPLWSADESIAALAKYIPVTTTCFPLDMFPPSSAPSHTRSSPPFSPSPRLRFCSVEET